MIYVFSLLVLLGIFMLIIRRIRKVLVRSILAMVFGALSLICIIGIIL